MQNALLLRFRAYESTPWRPLVNEARAGLVQPGGQWETKVFMACALVGAAGTEGLRVRVPGRQTDILGKEDGEFLRWVASSALSALRQKPGS